MKVALIHDWLTGMRGGEKCLEVFCEIFPEADLFTLLHLPGKVSKTIESRSIRTSFIQRLPRAAKKYRLFLPLFPAAIERFDLSEYDLVLSSSHCVAKGAIPKGDSLHLCYCYTPMRYMWDMFHHYFPKEKMGWAQNLLIPPLATYLRGWDTASSARVDTFIAISHYVARRIKKYYHRDSVVIYPPVEGSYFAAAAQREEGFFLTVSALVPYKRLDLAVEASNRLGFHLVIIGEGPELRNLKRIAGKKVEFLGWQPQEVLKDYYARCRAFIFPAEEDFGITPLEAMCSGKPVIAYERGGASETVIPVNGVSAYWPSEDGPTGVFFPAQTPESLMEAVRLFEKVQNRFDPRVIRNHALRFDRPVFKAKIKAFLEEKVKEWGRPGSGRRRDRAEAA